MKRDNDNKKKKMSVGLIKARCPGLLGLLSAVCFSAGQNLMFQISCLPDEPVRKLVRDATPLSAGISILILFTVSMLLKLLAGKWGTALFLGSILMTVWAAANYFTILYHGAPLFVSELKSAGTAMEVMGTYEFGFDPPVRKIIIIGGIMIASESPDVLGTEDPPLHCRQIPGRTGGVRSLCIHSVLADVLSV